MCLKKEPKSFVARKCWTKQWTTKITHPKKINITTVLYSHRMSSYKDIGPPKTHLILEAFAVMALANLVSSGVVGEDEVGTDSED